MNFTPTYLKQPHNVLWVGVYGNVEREREREDDQVVTGFHFIYTAVSVMPMRLVFAFLLRVSAEFKQVWLCAQLVVGFLWEEIN